MIWLQVSIGNRTAKSQLLLDIITESQFADDAAALYATTEENLQTMAGSFMSVASIWGFAVSLKECTSVMSKFCGWCASVCSVSEDGEGVPLPR